MAKTGVANTCITDVEYMAQRNKGKRFQVMPGARILWMVTIKFTPVKILENPRIKAPKVVWSA